MESGDEETQRCAPYAFVPTALRHDFWRDSDEQDDGGDARQNVENARRTRSALLVATLLYGDKGHQHDGERQKVQRRQTRNATKAKERPTDTTKNKPPDDATATVTPTAIAKATPTLYSLSMEVALSRRMAFANAVHQLDDYFNGLRGVIDELHKTHSPSIVPKWVWDRATKLPTLLQLQRKIVQSVASCLPDCDVYLAMYEPLPMADPTAATPWPLLRYMAASPQSSMVGRVLARQPSSPQGPQSSSAASFTVLDSLDPLLIQDVGEPAAANAVQWLGRVDAGSVMTGPFVCLPLVEATGIRSIGVLSLDACRKAAQLRPEAMSPQALFEFLARVHLQDAAVEFRKLQFGGRQFLQLTANDLQHRAAYRLLKIQTKQRLMEIVAALRSGVPLHVPCGQRPQLFCDDDEALTSLDDVCEKAGGFLDEYARRVHWHRAMAIRTRDVKATALDVYAALVHGISRALINVERVCVWKIRSYEDLDTLATTHLPDERLMPFLQWSERQIRRVPLYTENNEDHGRLMQGNITRIHLPPSPPSEQSQSPPSQPCERALYHVTWANRSQQSLSWPQLRLVLAVRPMNARHYQFAQLLQRLQCLRSDSIEPLGSGTYFHLTDPRAFVVLLKDPHRPDDVIYALEVDIVPLPADGTCIQFDEPFIQRAVAITEQNLLCVRGRQARASRRQMSTMKTTRSFDSFGLAPSADALRALDEIVAFVFEEIHTNLPGAQEQIAELHCDGTQLCYSFAGHGSTLAGKTLNRGQGVSFRCIDSRTPLIVDQGSELCHRLKVVSAGPVDMDADLPYVFLPLLYEDTCIGVLSVNRFANVPKGRQDDAHPEDGVVEYLSSLAKIVAAAIYLKRRAFVLFSLQQLRLDPLQSPEQLFFTAGRLLQDTMIGVWKLRVVEIDFVRGKSTTVFEYSEAARLQAETVQSRRAIPLGFRAKELLADTVAAHWVISREEVDTILRLWQQHEGKIEVEESDPVQEKQNEMERRKAWEARVRNRYYRLELTPLEDEIENSSNKNRESQASKALATRTSNQKYVSQALSTSVGTKTVAYAGIDALNIGTSSALYLTVAFQPQFFATCEQRFVGRVAETLSRGVESLVQRVNRSRERVAALWEVQSKCSEIIDQVKRSLSQEPSKPGYFPVSPSEELRAEGLVDLLDEIVRFVSTVLENPTVYVALHEPLHRRLRYVAASPNSAMNGKLLHRGHGVSFYALDRQQPLVVTAATQDQFERQYAKLRRFSTDPLNTSKWPFIVVPMESVGILALDNLETLARLTSEAQPEFGLVDFLRRSARIVGETVAKVRTLTRTHRQQRREEAIVSVMAACEDRSKHSSALSIQQIVLQAIERAFQGVDAYIGVLQPLCSSIIFAAATSRSNMAVHHVNAVDSVSFRVLLSQRPLVIPQVERKQFDAIESQAAQLLQQLRWFTASQDQGRKGPFVCIPIPFLGVLSVDTFPGAAGGMYSPHIPERGVVECLTTMANLLGQSMRERTAAETVRDIPMLFEGNRSSFRGVFTRLLELVAKNVLTAVELSVVCYDAVSWESVHDVMAPLVSLTSRVDQHRVSSISDLASSISQTIRTRCKDDSRCFSLPENPEVLILHCPNIRDIDSAGHGAIEWHQSCRSLATAIVIRRVHGATWSYDQEFLLDILPAIDALAELVNLRVCGLASRQNARRALDILCTALEITPTSASAVESTPRFVQEALNIVTQAASQVPGDAYVGERNTGGEFLAFTAASQASLMAGVQIDLLAVENQDLVSVTCLQRQRHLVVHLLDGKNDRLVRPLTRKKIQRLFAALPMSEDRLLCIDSLSADAFDPIHFRLESDVEAFLLESAVLLETTISSTRYRFAYDQLSCLKSKRHANFREFFATIHSILRRELNDLHSQQIVELADDFTGQFSVSSWHRAATRRPIGGSVPLHFCFTNGCTREWITQEIHCDHHMLLPMTNVPRTLDQSRATMAPVVGREKQRAYACDCLATILDSTLEASPRLALCVYSHDTTSSKAQNVVTRPTAFTGRQRQFFFALSVVASEVYGHVFRSCVLDSFDLESLFIARDRLQAKDAVLLAVADDDQVRIVSGCSVPAAKWLVGSVAKGKLAEKVQTFHDDSHAGDFAVLISMPTTAAGRTRSLVVKPQPAAMVSATTTTVSTESKITQTREKPSFFQRARLFGANDTRSFVPAPTSSEYAAPLPSLPTVEFHILLRGHHSDEILSLLIEREVSDHEDARERLGKELHQLVDEIKIRKAAFIAKPRGDEEWNGAGFGHAPEIGDGGHFGGGGFHVLACWTLWRDAWRDQLVYLETDMRGYLTGVQSTSREPQCPGVAPLSTAHVSIFSRENLAHRAAAVVVARMALVLCGYKKEVVIDSSSEKDDDHLKEYLRVNAGRKILELNPRTTAKWAIALRAYNYVKARQSCLASLSLAAITDAGRSARTLVVVVSTFASAVKYFKFLQDAARQRKLHIDTLATKIQCLYRLVLAHRLLRRLKIEYAAALGIQCAFRQHLARRKRVFLEWNQAARVVQRAYRRKIAQRRGRRSRKLTLELRTVAAQYGTMQADAPIEQDDGAWKVDMAAFDSFKAYLESRAGKEQLKKEQLVITQRLTQVARHREQTLTTQDRLLADSHDIFELLDVEGSGELSRERTRELMTKLHVPLSEEEATDVIDMMDNDRSGAISFSEFTNWFTHEFPVLKKRSSACGVLAKRDRQWITDESARAAIRKRWRAHQTGGGIAGATQTPLVVETVEAREGREAKKD